MAPLAVPAVPEAEDPRLTATRLAQAFTNANGRLSCSRSWYDGVRADYAS